MSAGDAGAAAGRVPAWRRWLVPAALAASGVALVFAVLWGAYFAKPGIKVFMFDAGPVEGMHIGEVRAFPELDLYLVGMGNGTIRAVDGRIASNGCRARWEPEAQPTIAQNPAGRPGAFLDPCSGAVWAMTGNQVVSPGTPEPLRTFIVRYDTLEDGRQHVFVELVGRDPPTSRAQ